MIKFEIHYFKTVMAGRGGLEIWYEIKGTLLRRINKISLSFNIAMFLLSPNITKYTTSLDNIYIYIYIYIYTLVLKGYPA